MSVLEKSIEEEIEIEQGLSPEEFIEDGVEEVASSGFNMGGFFEKLIKMLSAETGEGDISEYIKHPLNFNGSESVGQMIRGLTGMVGKLNKAVFDIIIGYARFKNEKKGV